MLQVAVLIASLAFLALVIALIPALLQVARTARQAEQTLATVDHELKPLTTQVQALLQEHRTLAQQATRDLRQIEGVAVMAQDVLGRVTNLTSLLASFGTVGRVVASRNSNFHEGDLVLGSAGWQDYALSDGGDLTPLGDMARPSYALSVLGMPGEESLQRGVTAVFQVLQGLRHEPHDGRLVRGRVRICHGVLRQDSTGVAVLAGGPS